MPPFSPAANGLLPNSMNEFCPEKPCQPSLRTQGGSMRPVERLVGLIVQLLGAALVAGVAIENPVQSAVVQYTAPGTCSACGTDTVSKVFAMLAAIAELPQGAVGGLTALPHGVPSAGPPASYTTWVPVFL